MTEPYPTAQIASSLDRYDTFGFLFLFNLKNKIWEGNLTIYKFDREMKTHQRTTLPLTIESMMHKKVLKTTNFNGQFRNRSL